MAVETFFFMLIFASSVTFCIVTSFTNNAAMLKYSSLIARSSSGLKRIMLEQTAATHTSFENNEYHRLIQHAAAWYVKELILQLMVFTVFMFLNSCIQVWVAWINVYGWKVFLESSSYIIDPKPFPFESISILCFNTTIH